MRTTDEHKKTICIFIALLMIIGIVTPSCSYAAVWVGGSQDTDQLGVYGTKGVADASNWPGARGSGVSWTVDNVFWLFGGSGYGSTAGTGRLNDLWKYDISTSIWTWVSGSNGTNQTSVYGTQGVANASNIPGARLGSVCWSDNDGDIWLFGGFGYDTTSIGNLNDLWKYDTLVGMWTWVSGSNGTEQTGAYGTQGVANVNNVPGARWNSVSWIDSDGNFWLFGGYNGTRLNDLWKYNIDNGMWTWMAGSDTAGQIGVYGIQGVANANNTPGARMRSIGWIDYDNGQLWLFGGSGHDEYSSLDKLNDVWSYDISTGMWTWQSGSNMINQLAVYGAKGFANVTNVPGARYSAIGWTDNAGEFWMFGGSGYDTANDGYLNDFWKFDQSTKMWTWIAGASSINQYGVYGTQGVADASNWPGARYFPLAWVSRSDQLWLFGGYGYNTTTIGFLNDLWKSSCDNLIGDLNDDCIVDLFDLAVLSGNWLKKGDIE